MASTRFFSSTGTPTLASLAPTMKTSARHHPPLVLPQVGEQPLSVAQSVWRARLRRGGSRRAGMEEEREFAGTAHRGQSGLVSTGRDCAHVRQFKRPEPPATGALPTDKELVLKVIPMPADANANGDIFGGWVMAQVDLAGSVLPARYAKGRMATVAVNEFVFKQPVRVGDILSFFAERHAHRPHLDHGAGRGVRRALPRRASTSR